MINFVIEIIFIATYAWQYTRTLVGRCLLWKEGPLRENAAGASVLPPQAELWNYLQCEQFSFFYTTLSLLSQWKPLTVLCHLLCFQWVLAESPESLPERRDGYGHSMLLLPLLLLLERNLSSCWYPSGFLGLGSTELSRKCMLVPFPVGINSGRRL